MLLTRPYEPCILVLYIYFPGQIVTQSFSQVPISWSGIQSCVLHCSLFIYLHFVLKFSCLSKSSGIYCFSFNRQCSYLYLLCHSLNYSFMMLIVLKRNDHQISKLFCVVENFVLYANFLSKIKKNPKTLGT